MELKNKIAIVTGASSGIGLETAKLMAKKGAKVVLAARSKEKLEELLRFLPDSLAIQADMTDMDSIKNMIDKTVGKFGRIDVLVNNAGQGIYGAIENVDIGVFKKIFELNVIGPLRAMQLVVPVMRKQGGGAIVNVSSMVSKMFIPFLGLYASTKYALNAISLTARTELEKDNVIVSVVYPGLTATDFGKNAVKSDSAAQAMQSRRREGLPEPDSAEHVAKRILLAIETGNAETFARDPKI